MENKASNASRHHANHSPIIGTLFFTLFHLVLLSIFAWIVLEIWLSVQVILSNSIGANANTQQILNYYLLIIDQYKLRGINTLFSAVDQLNNTIYFFLDKYIDKNTIEVFINSVKIIWVRIVLFIHFIPFMTVILSISVIDGLVLRDKRKFQCARESTFLFHRLKPLASLSFFTLFFVYMVFPYCVPFSTFLIPMTILSSIFTAGAIKNFKKYL